MAGSLLEQVAWLYRRNRGTGESRAGWRATHRGFGRMAEKTFAWNSEKRYKAVSVHFVKWCRAQYQVQQIRDITPEMVRSYIGARLAAGLSPRTLATDITAIRRLGMYAEMAQWIKVNFVPNDLSVPHGSSPRYSYTPNQECDIIAWVAERNPLAAEVLRWQHAAGLRISEAILARLDKIDFERGTIEVKGKGGRIRVVTVTDRELLDRLDRTRRFPLLSGLARNWTRTIEKLVHEACTELNIKPLGTHAFRAGAAQRHYDDLRERGFSDRAARKAVSKLLGHNRISVTNSYAP